MPTQKVARLCWNTNSWSKPSGPKGKSKNKKSFEFQRGFGHEEWLFDTTKSVGGYQYGFLQGVGQHYEKYIGECFDIFLYAINSTTRSRWWIGSIKNVTVIGESEASQVATEYRLRGWQTEMDEQLTAAIGGRNYPSFNTAKLAVFNIKFLPVNLRLLDPPIQFPIDDPAVASNYYNLLNFVSEPADVVHLPRFQFSPGHASAIGSATRSYEGGSVEVDLAEKRMQTAVFDHLCQIYGVANVRAEAPTGYGTLVDLVVRHVNKNKPDSFTFYELKVLESPRMCIRHALAQLLEYCYYPNTCRAARLVIVSTHYENPEIRQYLHELRRQFAIPVFYQRFDVEKQEFGSGPV